MPSTTTNEFSSGALVVRESKRFNYVIGAAIIVFGVVMALIGAAGPIVAGIILLAGIGTIIKGWRSPVILAIGPGGIQHGGNLVTGWDRFVRAQVRTEEFRSTRGIDQVRQVLLVQHYDEQGNLYQRKIELPEMRDHDDSAIIAAIRAFSG
ncbi:hypothetical protein EPD60_15690 [Flaviaesturariibacter flavus]|uniref:Uncharacterized protein n=1 Tax=Flaviaesturariibacter flavus TaxID=2502780 RepID=A0A4R1B6Q7_9BACT|nr:hypothetical protein [Flaviaesturariibacter flavus]TCJ11998.1 hypothetical protein EPD60_15690 [Flaviaesturariibacter flavus]